MTYPIPNYSRIWVRGRIIDLGKAVTEQSKYGVSGSVTFTPSVKVLVNTETQQIIASSPFRVNVNDTNGYFQIQLPASDDPDVTPTNFTYNVSEPSTGRSYNILVPQNTPVLNKPGDPLHGQPVIELSDIVPAPGPSSGLVQLVSGRGIDSVDIVDGNWVATYTDDTSAIIGPAPTGGGVSSLAELSDVDTSGAATGGAYALELVSAGQFELANARTLFAPVTGATRGRIGVAFLGDSITDYEVNSGRAWHKQLGNLSGQRALWRGYGATGGYTLAQIETTHLPAILAFDPLPQIVVIAGGTNDTGAAVGYSEATSRATLLRIAAALEAKGIKPGLWTLPPRDDSPTVRDRVTRWNAWIYRTALANGWPVVDAYSALVDPATGLYKTALKQDDVHPNNVGHLAIAQRALADQQFMKHVVDFNPDLATSATDTANVAQIGLFVGDSNADGLADGWSGFGTYTKSLIAAPYGNWQRISLASGTAAGGGAFRQDFPITEGRRYALAGKFHVDLDPAVPALNYAFSGEWRSASAAVRSDTLVQAPPVLDTYLTGYRELVAPAGATLLRLTGIIQGGTPTRNVYADASQVTVRDVTGLATPAS